jgi:murein DD-endopeptidase MepM/ murein hydrolase activator NlpD
MQDPNAHRLPLNSIFTSRRPAFAMFASVPIILLSVGGFVNREPEAVTAPPPSVARPAPPPGFKTVAGVFAANRTVTEALRSHGFNPEQIFQLVRDALPVYNLARVVAGRPYWVEVNSAGGIHSFRYPLDDERYLTVYRHGDQYVPVMKQFPYSTRVEAVSGEIRDSLFSAITGSGEEERLGLDLADIFMWDIDFYTELQPGDSFRLLVEKKYLDGKFFKYGPILAATFLNQNRTLTAFRFEARPGAAEYFDANGKALKRSFLKSPLKFARITSRFSNARRHPILRIVRPHHGVDYAAPAGTPVVAVGAGTVAAAGSTPQGGKMVRIRHAGGYETYYLHLMRIAVRSGSTVNQNQVIGYVGSTGLSTGPHLDFRVTQRGRFINPAKVIFPPSSPVPPSEYARFAAARDPLLAQLSSTSF